MPVSMSAIQEEVYNPCKHAEICPHKFLGSYYRSSINDECAMEGFLWTLVHGAMACRESDYMQYIFIHNNDQKQLHRTLLFNGIV